MMENRNILRCSEISNKLIFINDRIAFCCGFRGKGIYSPAFQYLDTSVKTIENFLEKRKIVEEELNGKREINLCKSCVGCKNLKSVEKNYELSKINHINLSFAPFFCQCKCIYCGYVDNPINDYEKAKNSDIVFQIADMIKYLEINGLLDSNCTFNIGSGEITVHPHKDAILDVVAKYSTCFYTNGFVYDEKIEQVLRTNPKSSINLSLDSGTKKTFKAVKGSDVFYKVLQHLNQYSKHGKITLKYILMPGINDSGEDLRGFITILKSLNLNFPVISRNTNIDIDDKYLRSHALFDLMLKDAGFTIFTDFQYSDEDIEKIKNYSSLQVFDERINEYKKENFTVKIENPEIKNRYGIKKIWTYWETPHNKKFPEYLECCFDTWKKNMPEVQAIVVNQKNYMDYIDVSKYDFSFEKLFADYEPQQQSNVIRMCLLQQHGGLWLDLDTIVFDDIYEKWINPDCNADDEKLYAFNYDETGFDNCIIYAPKPGNAFIKLVIDKITLQLNGELDLTRKPYWQNRAVMSYSIYRSIAEDLGVGFHDMLTQFIFTQEYIDFHNSLTVMTNNFSTVLDSYKSYYFIENNKNPSEELKGRAQKGFIILRNVWIPQEIKSLTREEFLESDYFLTRLIRYALGLPEISYQSKQVFLLKQAVAKQTERITALSKREDVLESLFHFYKIAGKIQWLKNIPGLHEFNGSTIDFACGKVLFETIYSLKPRAILELGIGLSTRIITQYAENTPKVQHIVVESSKEWVQRVKPLLCPVTEIKLLELQKVYFGDFYRNEFIGFSDTFKGKKFDLIFIDAPPAFVSQKQEVTPTRQDIVSLIPDILSEKFALIIHNYNRKGEQSTCKLIEEKLTGSKILFSKKVIVTAQGTVLLTNASS